MVLHLKFSHPGWSRHERKGRGLLDDRAQRTVDRRWGVLHGAQQYLIALRSPLDPDALAGVKSALTSRGGWVSSYVPDGSVLGIGTAAAAQAAGRVPGVLWVVRPWPSDFCMATLHADHAAAALLPPVTTACMSISHASGYLQRVMVG